jgi:hypothetical protein
MQRTRDRFGGLDVPATIAGALTALATAVIVGGILGAAVSGFGYQQGVEVAGIEQELSLAGLLAAIAVLFGAFLVGGWVAGRMARFERGHDDDRQRTKRCPQGRRGLRITCLDVGDQAMEMARDLHRWRGFERRCEFAAVRFEPLRDDAAGRSIEALGVSSRRRVDRVADDAMQRCRGGRSRTRRRPRPRIRKLFLRHRTPRSNHRILACDTCTV